MSNRFLGFLATAGKDVVHVVEEAPKVAVALGDLLKDGVSVEPAVKTAIQNVMSAAEAVAVAGGPAALDEGKDITLDLATVASVQNLIKVFMASYPVIVKGLGVVVTDVEATVKAAS